MNKVEKGRLGFMKVEEIKKLLPIEVTQKGEKCFVIQGEYVSNVKEIDTQCPNCKMKFKATKEEKFNFLSGIHKK